MRLVNHGFSNVLRELNQGLRVRWACAQGQLGSWEFVGDVGHWETEPGQLPKKRGATVVKGRSVEKKQACYMMPQACACGLMCKYIYIYINQNIC